MIMFSCDREGHSKHKNRGRALTGVAQRIGGHPANQKVISLIPVRAHAWVAGPGPQLGPCKRQPTDVLLTYCYFSLCFSLLSPLSKNK